MPGFDHKNVIIMGVWGRAGGDGIPELINFLRPKLVDLGVKPNNVFSMSWNPRGNDDPIGKPDTRRHLKEIKQRTSEASYVAIIGHSYGGWAACILSTKIDPLPNFVGLIDPVFGPFGDDEKIVLPQGRKIYNWYQRVAIKVPPWIDCLEPHIQEKYLKHGCRIEIPNGLTIEGLSCGRKIESDGVKNCKLKWSKDWDGNFLEISCLGGGKAKRYTCHTDIDSDKYIWRQIFDHVTNDLKASQDN